MKESDAAKRAKQQLDVAESRLATGRANLADIERQVLAGREEIKGLERQMESFRYIINGETGHAQTPAPKRAYKKKDEQKQTNTVTTDALTFPDKYICLECECESKGEPFSTPHVPAPGRRNAGKAVCPKCLSENIRPVED